MYFFSNSINASFDATVLAAKEWVVALNRDNDAVQNDLTAKIRGLDVVAIRAWIDGHRLLAELVEHLT